MADKTIEQRVKDIIVEQLGGKPLRLPAERPVAIVHERPRFVAVEQPRNFGDVGNVQVRGPARLGSGYSAAMAKPTGFRLWSGITLPGNGCAV